MYPPSRGGRGSAFNGPFPRKKEGKEHEEDEAGARAPVFTGQTVDGSAVYRGTAAAPDDQLGDRRIPGKSIMAEKAAALQTYNNELVKCLEELCFKREEVNRQIEVEEEERERLQRDVRLLTEKLDRVTESLTQRYSVRASFDRTINETHSAYTKILESSQSLLSVLKQETGNLSKASEPRRKDH